AASGPRVVPSSSSSLLLRGLDRGLDDRRVEVLHQLANESVLADRRRGAVARGVAAGLSDAHGEPHRPAEMLLQRRAELVLEALLGEVLHRGRHAQLERLAVEALQLARLRELLGDAAEVERVRELRPVAVES